MPTSSYRHELRKCLGDTTDLPPAQPSALAANISRMMHAGLREVNTIDDWWKHHVEVRFAVLGDTSRINIDRSPTGTGKSHADTPVVSRVSRSGRRSLTLVQDHNQCREAVAMRGDAGVKSVAFPELNEDSCIQFDVANDVMKVGLSVSLALCPKCPHADECTYREEQAAASKANNVVATQARAGVHPEILENQRYIAIHEQPINMLRPNYSVNAGLKQVADLMLEASYRATDARDRGFYRYAAAQANRIHGEFMGSSESCGVALPTPAVHVPDDLHAALYRAAQEGEARRPPANALRLVLATVLGKLEFIEVSVDEKRKRRRDDEDEDAEVELFRVITGVGRTDLPLDSTIVLNDATGSIEEYEAVLGRPVRDITPQGGLARKHPVLQIAPHQDVTRGTGVARAAEVVCGVLNDIPHQRVGLLTHRPLHKKVLARLAKYGVNTTRLSKVSYFGNESRGSNRWIGECDALVIVGTPRIPPESIRHHLLLIGKRAAARLRAAEAGWHVIRWTARTESGKERAVATQHYRDPDWHAAYLSLVRAELVQAIGRGRGLLDKGIPVYVVTTENLGDICPIADHPYARLTYKQAAALRALEGTDGTSKERTRKTETVGRCIEVGKDRAYQILAQLVRDGRVKRRGERGGWYLPPPQG